MFFVVPFIMCYNYFSFHVSYIYIRILYLYIPRKKNENGKKNKKNILYNYILLIYLLYLYKIYEWKFYQMMFFLCIFELCDPSNSS